MAVGWAEERSPHPLFDTSWYLLQNPDVEEECVNPLEHFLQLGWREKRNPHPLFDISFYFAHSPDVEAAGINPVLHYIKSGWREGRQTHPSVLLNADLSTSENPLIRLIKNRRMTDFSRDEHQPPDEDDTHSSALETTDSKSRAHGSTPVRELASEPEILSEETQSIVDELRSSEEFDHDWYLATYPDVAAAGIDPIEHYVVSGASELRNPSPKFSTGYYLDKYTDVAVAGINPFLHWVQHGRSEGRTANISLVSQEDTENTNCPEIIFVSHDASQTGAPSVLLSLMRWIKLNTSIRFSIIVGQSGPWNDKFKELAPTFFIDQYGDRENASLDTALRAFCGNMVQCVYLNTIATGFIAKELKFLHAKFFCHIHEMEYAFTVFERHFEEIRELCTNFIVVSEGSKTAALTRLSSDNVEIAEYRPFIEPYTPQTLETSLDLQPCFNVFSCGTCGDRKGFDLFCKTAQQLKERKIGAIKMYWIGGVEHPSFNPSEIIDSFGVENLVEYLGPQDHPRDYFAQGHAFLLPSRGGSISARLPRSGRVWTSDNLLR